MEGSRILLNFADLMGERNPIGKSQILGDKMQRYIFEFWG